LACALSEYGKQQSMQQPLEHNRATRMVSAALYALGIE
jgi:hypothetical protein